MARKPPSIAEQVRAALDSVFGRERQAPRRKKRKPARRVATRKKRPSAPPQPKRKVCSVCGEIGHNARHHRSAPSSGVSSHAGHPHVVAEVPSAPPAPPDPPASPAEGDPASREVEAAGTVVEYVEGAGPAAAAETEAGHAGDPTRRRRGPRRCTICGELGHDRRICPKRGTDGGDSAQEPNMEPPAPAPPPEAPNSTHEARVVEFRRLAAHFPALDDRTRSVALLVAQGYDPGAIAGDLRIKRFDVYQLLDAAIARLRRADIAAACVLLGLSAAPTRSSLPVKEMPPEPEADRPTYDREDLDAIAAMAPDLPEPPSPPPPPAEPKPERLVRVSDIKDRHRAHTIRSPQRLTREERRAGEQLVYPEDVERPRTRGDCEPCIICQEWRDATKADRDSGTALRNAGGAGEAGRRLAGPLRLREGAHGEKREAQIGQSEVMRLPAIPSRRERDPGVSDLGSDAPTVLESSEQELPGLWWERNSSRAPVEEVRGVPRRHGTTTIPGADDREDQQRRPLRAWQLPVGDEIGPEQEQEIGAPANDLRTHSKSHRLGERDGPTQDAHRQQTQSGLERLACGHTTAEALIRSRPCLFVGCGKNLFLDVSPGSGAIKLNQPHLNPDEVEASCSLDVADCGPHTLEQVGALINCTRERVRQIEVGAVRNREAKKIAEDIEFVDHDDESPIASAIG